MKSKLKNPLVVPVIYNIFDVKISKVTFSYSLGSGAKRHYNYRVVMVKSGVEMDMRGRCSAGQKVRQQSSFGKSLVCKGFP